MIKKILDKIWLLYKINISLRLSSKKKILIYDEIHLLILSKFLKKDFNSLHLRKKKNIDV
jgi:hypothetical protein